MRLNEQLAQDAEKTIRYKERLDEYAVKTEEMELLLNHIVMDLDTYSELSDDVVGYIAEYSAAKKKEAIERVFERNMLKIGVAPQELEKGDFGEYLNSFVDNWFKEFLMGGD